MKLLLLLIGIVTTSTILSQERIVDECYPCPEAIFTRGDVRDYIKKHIELDSCSKNVEGKVYILFTVLKSGKVSDVKLAKGLSPCADEAALKVIREMPDWIPAACCGKIEDTRMRIPVLFTKE